MLLKGLGSILLRSGMVIARWSIRVSASELESIDKLSTSKVLKNIHCIGGTDKDQCTMPFLTPWLLKKKENESEKLIEHKKYLNLLHGSDKI
jgi:hypothetical protein